MSESNRPSLRIGDHERDAALEKLSEHMRAGRLDPSEFSERSLLVAQARFAEDLAPLFKDLPGNDVAAIVPASDPDPDPDSVSLVKRPSSARPSVRAVGGLEPRQRKTIVALTPFVALVLFFGAGAMGGWAWCWIFFLLIPVTAIVLGDDHAQPRGIEGRERHRRRDEPPH